MAPVIPFDVGGLLAEAIAAERLDSYHEALFEQNRSLNLVSRETTRADFDRMAAESILPLRHLDGPISSYVDIGSGGGMPSIPIMLARSDIERALLVERTGKKAVALRDIVSRVGLSAEIFERNFDEYRSSERFDLATLRYVKLTSRLLGKIMSVLKPGGHFVYYSTPEFKLHLASVQTYHFESGQESVLKSFTIIKK